MTSDESVDPQVVFDVEIEAQVEQCRRAFPAAGIQQQVVALDNHAADGGSDPDLTEHRLLGAPVEARRTDYRAVGAESTADRDKGGAKAVDVEGVGGAHPLAAAQFDQTCLRQVEAIHRQHRGGCPEQVRKLARQRRLARAGSTGDTDHDPMVGRHFGRDDCGCVGDRVQRGRDRHGTHPSSRRPPG